MVFESWYLNTCFNPYSGHSLIGGLFINITNHLCINNGTIFKWFGINNINNNNCSSNLNLNQKNNSDQFGDGGNDIGLNQNHN